MLNDSVLGAVYRCWLGSRCFALLQCVYAAVAGQLRGSLLLSALFGESPLDARFRASGTARLLRRLWELVTGLGEWLGRQAAGSAICTALAPLLRESLFCRFELLFSLFLCAVFAVPHAYWNNLLFVLGAFGFLCLYLLPPLRGKRERLRPDQLGLWFFLFLLSCLLSMGFTSEPGDSLRILLFLLASCTVCYLIAAAFSAPEKLRILLGAMYAALLLIGLYAIAQHMLGLVEVNESFTDVAINKGVPGRVTGTLDNPNNLAEFILMFLPLGAALAGSAKKEWQRYLLAAGLCIPALAMLWTYSRAGWLSLCLAAAVFLWCVNKRLMPALFLFGAALIPFLPASVMTRLATIGNAKDTSTLHRLYIWRSGLHMLGDELRWLTGIGLGPATFRNIFFRYALYTSRAGTYHTQMQYMELLLELGLVGCVSYFWMLVKTAGRTGRRLRERSGQTRLVLIACLAGLVGLAFEGTVEYIWFYQRCMFASFLFLGILFAALRSEE